MKRGNGYYYLLVGWGGGLVVWEWCGGLVVLSEGVLSFDNNTFIGKIEFLFNTGLGA